MTDPYSALIVCGGLLFATPLLFGVWALVVLVQMNCEQPTPADQGGG